MRPGSRGGDRACEGSLPTPERSCVSRFCPRAIISLSRLCIPAQAKNRQGRRHPLAPRPSLHPAGLGRWERGPEAQGRVWGASVADTGVCWAWGGWAPSLGYPPQGSATSCPPPPRVGGNRRWAGREVGVRCPGRPCRTAVVTENHVLACRRCFCLHGLGCHLSCHLRRVGQSGRLGTAGTLARLSLVAPPPCWPPGLHSGPSSSPWGHDQRAGGAPPPQWPRRHPGVRPARRSQAPSTSTQHGARLPSSLDTVTAASALGGRVQAGRFESWPWASAWWVPADGGGT